MSEPVFIPKKGWIIKKTGKNGEELRFYNSVFDGPKWIDFEEWPMLFSYFHQKAKAASFAKKIGGVVEAWDNEYLRPTE